METRIRPAARVVCLDAAQRVLLLHWRDPADGSWLWEPPGGGIDPGETPLDAARRELVEETGLDPAAVRAGAVDVARDQRWNGARYVGVEQFFLARFAEDRPVLVRTGLLPDEQENLHDHAWVGPDDLPALPDRLEPPELAKVIAALAGPASAWARLG
ncbi:NUDIX domain-containing protein [Dactylosporangium sp. NPDC051485]|uniref:NUDIX hydrolase n=1 Tax=Dactylosporangium sp. NPDC051485 TaxID=3154846 RepID=UPI0034243BBA